MKNHFQALVNLNMAKNLILPDLKGDDYVDVKKAFIVLEAHLERIAKRNSRTDEGKAEGIWA